MRVVPASLERRLDLPSLYTLKVLREHGDAFAHARSIAAEGGAGTLVWVGRYDVAEFAVVLEPEEPLRQARPVFYACMNALADTIASLAPPETPLSFEWPDALRLDAGLLGGGRIGWPEAAPEDETPDWLVFGAMLRVSAPPDREPGEWKRGVTLEEQGFFGVGAADVIETFARNLMAALHDWGELGPAHEFNRWLRRYPSKSPALTRIDAEGDLIGAEGRRDFVQALSTPSWLDTERDEPWL